MENTRKKTFIIFLLIFLPFIIVAVVFASLSKHSKAYNDMRDKIGFERLCHAVRADNIKDITVTKPNKGTAFITDYIDFSVFDDMSYAGSAWNVEVIEWTYRVGIYLKDSPDEVVISSKGTERFMVYYQDRLFFIDSPDLLAAVKTAIEYE